MFERAARRTALSAEGGFTLLELAIVLLIAAILLSVALGSFLGGRERAQESAAQAYLRTSLPAIEAYRADRGSYAGMTPAALAAYDSGVQNVAVKSAAAATYCVERTAGSPVHRKNGPLADIVPGTCS